MINGIGDELAETMVGFSSSPTINMITLAVTDLIIGTFMDANAVFLVTMATVLPVIVEIGADPLIR